MKKQSTLEEILIITLCMNNDTMVANLIFYIFLSYRNLQFLEREVFLLLVQLGKCSCHHLNIM